MKMKRKRVFSVSFEEVSGKANSQEKGWFLLEKHENEKKREICLENEIKKKCLVFILIVEKRKEKFFYLRKNVHLFFVEKRKMVCERKQLILFLPRINLQNNQFNNNSLGWRTPFSTCFDELSQFFVKK